MIFISFSTFRMNFETEDITVVIGWNVNFTNLDNIKIKV